MAAIITTIAENITVLNRRIAAACKQAGRAPDSLAVVAVAKTVGAAEVQLAAAAGIAHIGENYPQEAAQKMGELAHLPLVWHFVGGLQSNKCKRVAVLFGWVHSVDRLSVAQKLSAARQNLPPLNICLQVNIDREPGKNGVAAANLPTLANEVGKLPNLRLRGLMAIPAPTQEREKTRQSFLAMKKLRQELRVDGAPLDVLSIGMSGDFDLAIAAGATHLRIGAAIFGPRPQKTRR